MNRSYRKETPEELLIELPPEHVADLAEVSGAADCYQPSPRGGYELTPEARAYITSCNDDLKRQWAEGVAALEEEHKATEGLAAKLTELTVEGAIREALVAANVAPKLVKVLLAGLVQQLAPELDRDGAVVCKTEFGTWPAQEAVNQWLAGPCGAPFAPKAPTQEGPYLAAWRKIKQGALH